MPDTEGGILFLRRVVTALIAMTLWLAPSTVSGQARPSGGVRELRPGRALEREVTGSETHGYKFALRKNEFLQVRVEQRGADVVLRLFGTGGNELARMDSPNGKEGVETLTFVAPEAGVYTLEVGGLEPKAAKGRYRIFRETPRESTQRDKRRVEVERLFVTAGDQSASSPDPTDAGIKKWEEALAGWRELRDDYMAEQSARQLRRSKNAKAKALFTAAGQLAKRRDATSMKASLALLSEVRWLTHEIGEKRGEALSLNSLAQVHWALDDKRKAIEYYDQAVPLWVALGDRAEEAGALASLGNLSYSLGKVKEALEYFQRSLAPFRDARDAWGEATALVNIGSCYSKLGDNGKAVEHLNQSRSVWRAVNDRKGEAVAIVNLAAIRSATGSEREALGLYAEALAVFREAGDRKAEADALRNIGNVHSSLEERRQALEPYGQALAIYRSLDDKEGIVETLEELGFAHVNLGEKRAAIKYFVEALPLYKFTQDDWRERRTLANLGSLYLDLGEKEKALDAHSKGLELSREVDDELGVGTQLNNVGMVYAAVGEVRKAHDKYFKEALKVFEALRDTRRQAWTHMLLGILYTEAGYDRQALEAYERALSLYRESKDKGGEAGALHAVGTSYKDLGDEGRALRAFEEGLKIEEAGGTRAPILLSISNIHLGRGENFKALDYRTRALVESLDGGSTDGVAVSQSSLGYVWRTLGKKRLAVFYGKLAVNEYQELRQALGGMDYETQKAFLRRVDDFYYSLATSLIDAGRPAEAAEVINLYQDQQYFDFDRDPAERAKRVDLSRREAVVAERYRRAAEGVAQARWKIRRLKSRIGDDPPSEQQGALLRTLEAEWETAKESLVSILKEAEAEFSKPSGPEDEVPLAKDVAGLQKTLRDVGAATGQKAVALYTVPYTGRFNLLLISSDGVKAFTSPVKVKDLDERVLRFYSLLRSPRFNPRPLGKKLYDIILKPAQAELGRTGARTLLWMLGGTLRYVPMAALSPDGKGYLVERYQSVAFTRTNNEQLTRPVSRNWVGVGFGSTRAQDVEVGGEKFCFRELMGVDAEMRTLFGTGPNETGILPGEVFKDDEFTRDAFYDSLKARRPLVHISSHFFFRAGDSARSFLLLGKGPPLTLDELKVRGRLFESVELLTLSACNTAAQRPNADGSEVDGFAELAQRLGANAVMATLWPASDDSTPRLMSSFYGLRQQARGMTKAEALRRAQLSLLYGTPQTTTARIKTSDAVRGGAEPEVKIVDELTRGGFDDPDCSTGETVYVERRDARSYIKGRT